MDDETFYSLRHWGRCFRDRKTFSARMFSRRIREARSEGVSWADIAHAAQSTTPTVKKYAAMYAEEF